MLGDGLAVLAVPLLVLQLTRSPMAAVLAALPGSIGYLVAGLPAGVVIDRLNPWLVLICCDLLRGGIFLVLFEADPGARQAVTAWPAVLTSWRLRLAPSPCSPTPRSLVIVRDVAAGRPRPDLGNSWLESANQGGQIIGPGLAGLLASAGLLHVSMLIDAVTFGISLATLTWVRRAAGNEAPAGGPRRERVRWRAIGRELAAGLRYLAATRLLLTLLIFIAAVMNSVPRRGQADRVPGSGHPAAAARHGGPGRHGGRRGRAGGRADDRPARPADRAAAHGLGRGRAVGRGAAFAERCHLRRDGDRGERALHLGHRRGQRHDALAPAGAGSARAARPGDRQLAARRAGRHVLRRAAGRGHRGRQRWRSAAGTGRGRPAHPRHRRAGVVAGAPRRGSTAGLLAGPPAGQAAQSGPPDDTGESRAALVATTTRCTSRLTTR